MDAKTWNRLKALSETKTEMSLADFCFETKLGHEEALHFLKETFPQDFHEKVFENHQELWVNIEASSLAYLKPFSYALWDTDLSETEEIVLKFLDQSVTSHELVSILTHDHKLYNVFPCRVLHLEGNLSIIAEDSKDHCLMVIPMKDVLEASASKTTKLPKVVPYQVDEFISAIRLMNERETRLVLKIVQPEGLNLFPEHHFLGKPCMITNSNGDLIWAAYVEPCEALFDWVFSLGAQVEVLDPYKFKEQYFTYCAEKLRKIA